MGSSRAVSVNKKEKGMDTNEKHFTSELLERVIRTQIDPPELDGLPEHVQRCADCRDAIIAWGSKRAKAKKG
jgi:hypothetical protein